MTRAHVGTPQLGHATMAAHQFSTLGVMGWSFNMHGGGQQNLKRLTRSLDSCKTSACAPGARPSPNAATHAPPIRAERACHFLCCLMPGIRTRLPPPCCVSIAIYKAASRDPYRPNHEYLRRLCFCRFSCRFTWTSGCALRPKYVQGRLTRHIGINATATQLDRQDLSHRAGKS